MELLCQLATLCMDRLKHNAVVVWVIVAKQQPSAHPRFLTIATVQLNIGLLATIAAVAMRALSSLY